MVTSQETAFFTGRAPEVHVRVPASSPCWDFVVAGMTWKAAGCGRCQDLQGALSVASGQGQAGRAGLWEGAVGQPPAREACASPACLRLWEGGVA